MYTSLVTKAKQQGKLAPLNFKFQHQSFYFSLIPNRLSGLFPRHDIHIPIMYFFFYTAWASFGARVSSRLVDADYTPQPTSIYREENVEKDLSLNWQINTRVDSLQLLAPSRYTAAGAAPFFFFLSSFYCYIGFCLIGFGSFRSAYHFNHCCASLAAQSTAICLLFKQQQRTSLLPFKVLCI